MTKHIKTALCPKCETKVVSIDRFANIIIECGDHDFTISPQRILKYLVRTEEGRAMLNQTADSLPKRNEMVAT